MSVFSSLTNRLFLAMALLAVVSIGAATYYATAAVTAQAEGELRRGLEEAGTLVQEYRSLLFEHFTREAALVADLPRFKATVALNDPPTMKPIAEDYRKQLGADLLVVTNTRGTVLAEIASTGKDRIIDVVSVPILVIDPVQPEILGTLTVGFALDATRRRQVPGAHQQRDRLRYWQRHPGRDSAGRDLALPHAAARARGDDRKRPDRWR